MANIRQDTIMIRAATMAKTNLKMGREGGVDGELLWGRAALDEVWRELKLYLCVRGYWLNY